MATYRGSLDLNDEYTSSQLLLIKLAMSYELDIDKDRFVIDGCPTLLLLRHSLYAAMSRPERRTLYFGDLSAAVTEDDLERLIGRVAEFDSLHIARQQVRGRYHAYVNFYSEETARRVMNALDGEKLEGSHIRITPRDPDPSRRQFSDNNVIVKNVKESLIGRDLRKAFGVYGAIFSCKVEYDDAGMSKGFAFINFETEDGAREAVERANGAFLHGKKLEVEFHMTKNERLEAQQSKPFTNIYVKNLKGDCTDEELKTMFADFGPISSTCTKYFEKTGTRYGFVDFENSEDAALAVDVMDGRCVDGLKISVNRAQKIAERRAEFARERTNLYVRNLPTDMDDVELERLFGRFGEIVSAKMKRAGKRENVIGVGFVNFSDSNAATEAIKKMNGRKINGHALYVDYHQSKEERQAELIRQHSPWKRSSAPMYRSPSFPAYTYHQMF
ncbi:uncharacterized protein [Oscarella lobularis]|uniref:uncharacterized protein isoform X2 n=1 Tax=Oscarella lobularis TaxID=121494 RepID=UPI0033136925